MGITMQIPYGIERMENLQLLPYINTDSFMGQFSSYARNGDNDDGFHSMNFLYQDEHGDYVMCDLKGPGCINRIWMTGSIDCQRNYIKIYIDGEVAPRINVEYGKFYSGQWGEFLDPLTVDWKKSAGGQICYNPIAFSKSIKMTITGITETGDILNNPQFFYHVDYELFPLTTDIEPWSGAQSVSSVIDKWNNCGSDPKPTDGNTVVSDIINLPAGQTVSLLRLRGPGQIQSITLKIPDVPGDESNGFGRDVLNNVIIKIYWDNAASASVDCPIGAFFGIGNLGAERPCNGLMFGIDSGGRLYMFFPMPFAANAEILLLNKTGSAMSGVFFEIQHAPFEDSFERIGHFCAETNYVRVAKDDPFDVIALKVGGSGKVVGIQQSMNGPGTEPTYEEGDLRICIDNSSAPQFMGTGLEDSYNGAGYFLSQESKSGWGFYSNQLSGYLAREDNRFRPSVTMYRAMPHDGVNFRNGISVSMEHGGGAHTPGYYGTVSADYLNTVHYYWKQNPLSVKTDELNMLDLQSENAHQYQVAGETWSGEKSGTFEGQFDSVDFTMLGRAFKGSCQFVMSIEPENAGVVLRRTFDQTVFSQACDIYIDGIKLGCWYTPSGNIYYRWRDGDIVLPHDLTSGKKHITIRLDNTAYPTPWHEFSYEAYSLMPASVTNNTIRTERLYCISLRDGSANIELPGASPLPGTMLTVTADSNMDSQRFRIVQMPDGYCAIVSVISGLVLDVVNGSNDDGALVQQYKWDGNDYQLWRAEVQTDKSIVFYSKGSSKVLEANASGDALHQAAFNGSAGQYFCLIKKDAPAASFEIESGKVYHIYNENYLMAMDAAKSTNEDGIPDDTTDGTPIRQNFPNNTDAQKWQIDEVSRGYYKITNVNSGLVLGVAGNSSSNAATVIQSAWSNLHSQIWKFDSVGNGYYLMIPKSAELVNRCIDVPYASVKPTNLQLFDCNATAAQIWRLSLV